MTPFSIIYDPVMNTITIKFLDEEVANIERYHTDFMLAAWTADERLIWVQITIK